jgi:hypothetical protein
LSAIGVTADIEALDYRALKSAILSSDATTLEALGGPQPEEAFMNLKLIVAILVTTAMPVYAQAQDRNPVVTAAQRVVEIISNDPAKVETYCAIGKLGVQIEDANEAKDKKTADVLTQKMRGLEKQLGPEYLSLMYGLQEIDPESEDGVEIEAMLRPLDRSCARE